MAIESTFTAHFMVAPTAKGQSMSNKWRCDNNSESENVCVHLNALKSTKVPCAIVPFSIGCYLWYCVALRRLLINIYVLQLPCYARI